ncbi:MAG: type II toxin-antitoxin system VapC family toxin [Chthoniobacteraceae bacterium]
MIVADTSLIASLLLSTPATDAAENVLKSDPEWTAPDLWRYEFKNVLATRVRQLGLPLDHAMALFGKAEEVISPSDFEVHPGAILNLAHTKKLSAYDAEFVALAIVLRVKLVTLDRGILRAAPDVAISPEEFIKH